VGKVNTKKERNERNKELKIGTVQQVQYRPYTSYIYEGVSKVSGLAAWSENCKWYSSLLLSAVVSLFCESV
jgi:hypothetical protein